MTVSYFNLELTRDQYIASAFQLILSSECSSWNAQINAVNPALFFNVIVQIYLTAGALTEQN